MSIQLRKQLFLAVRDMPYKIGEKNEDASCVAKTKLLGELLCRIGLRCQVWSAGVKWSETGIPAELVQIAPRIMFNHIFLKALIPETQKWVIVDPTWDQRFTGKLTVNRWDGLTDTQLAYPSQHMQLVGTVAEYDFRNFDPAEVFTKKLNEWYLSLAKRNI